MRNILILFTIVSFSNAGCSNDSEMMKTADANTPDATSIADAGNSQPVFTHKMMKATGENPYASLGYECRKCTFEQFL